MAIDAVAGLELHQTGHHPSFGEQRHHETLVFPEHVGGKNITSLAGFRADHVTWEELPFHILDKALHHELPDRAGSRHSAASAADSRRVFYFWIIDNEPRGLVSGIFLPRRRRALGPKRG